MHARDITQLYGYISTAILSVLESIRRPHRIWLLCWPIFRLHRCNNAHSVCVVTPHPHCTRSLLAARCATISRNSLRHNSVASDSRDTISQNVFMFGECVWCMRYRWLSNRTHVNLVSNKVHRIELNCLWNYRLAANQWGFSAFKWFDAQNSERWLLVHRIFSRDSEVFSLPRLYPLRRSADGMRHFFLLSGSCRCVIDGSILHSTEWYWNTRQLHLFLIEK